MKRQVFFIFFIMMATILFSIFMGKKINDAYFTGSFSIWNKVTELPIIAKKIGAAGNAHGDLRRG